MGTDLLGAALAQLATLMAANWAIVEMLGARIPGGKVLRSLLVGPLLSMIAYGLGWFNALPSVAASGHSLTGWRAYLSAAFAGLIASILTSAAHKVIIGSKGARNGTQPLT